MAARPIRGDKKVALYAVGDSYVTLQGFANLLLKIGIVTYSGGLVNKFAHEIQLLRSQGCKTILVTANAGVRESIAGLECLLLLPEGETTRGSVATYYSQSSIRFALDCVCGECFAQGWQESMALRESFAKNDLYLRD